MIEVVYEWSSNTTNMVTLDFLVLGKLPPMPAPDMDDFSASQKTWNSSIYPLEVKDY